MTALLWALGGAVLGLVIGHAGGRLEQRRLANVQIERLHDAIRLRQLWAQARRYEVATLLRLRSRGEFVTHAETLGPLLEPTAWIRGGGDNLSDARDLLEAAKPLVYFGAKLAQRVAEKEG